MLFKNGLVCDHLGYRRVDIRIFEDKIIEVSSSLIPQTQEKVFDCTNKLIIPALIDLCVYPKSKILSQKTLISLSKKALNGGVGTMLILPDTYPPCENEAMIELIKSFVQNIETTMIPSIKPTNNEGKINDISILHSQGGKSIYIDSTIDGNNLLRIAQYASMLEIPLICFAQDTSIANGVINEGRLASMLGLPAISPLSQTKEIAKVAEVARHTGTQMIFHGVTEPVSFEIINFFNSKNARLFAQTPIHHLILDEGACANYNAKAKLNPPLKDFATKEKLLSILASGHIDMLTCLQRADYNSQKDQVFEMASFGIDSIGFYFSLAYTYLILAGYLKLEDFLKIASKNQATLLNLNKGEILVGRDSDFLIVDTAASTEISDSFSPYYGQSLSSKIVSVVLGGKVYE